ncbi:MAG: hypothetical protein D6791_10725 [Chloroflexi bacterium]|nr:MAG: hypothetical protein D6791_10725 [Chloroflexota bacterium]
MCTFNELGLDLLKGGSQCGQIFLVQPLIRLELTFQHQDGISQVSFIGLRSGVLDRSHQSCGMAYKR